MYSAEASFVACDSSSQGVNSCFFGERHSGKLILEKLEVLGEVRETYVEWLLNNLIQIYTGQKQYNLILVKYQRLPCDQNSGLLQFNVCLKK